MTDQPIENSMPITVVISRRVKKGKEKAFEKLSTKMTEAAARFPGHQGAVFLRPGSPSDPEYRIIFKFDNREHLDAWLASDEREGWLKDIESQLEKPSAMEVMPGLVPWFSLPGQNPVQPPLKYKMAIVTWLAIFPTVSFIFWLFGERLLTLPLLLRTSIMTAFIVILMTYIIMPQFTRWFSFWLFPKQDRDVR